MLAPTSFKRLPWLLMALGLTTVLYTWDLAHAPVYLGGDEAHFGVHAYSIAHSGRDLDGRFMPLLFHLEDPLGDQNNPDIRKRWYQPALMYLTAAALTVLPLTEASIRMPTALVGGLLNPLLMYAVALRLFGRRLVAAVVAAMLVLSPAHFILARQALDYVCPLPFMLGWLLCLVTFIQGGGLWLPAAGGLLLGVGFFSYIASWMLMPLYVLLSCVAYAVAGRGGARASMAAAAGFALPVLFVVPWLWTHPDMLRETSGRYELHGGIFRLMTVEAKLSEYWDYFDPAFLFLRGGASMTTSTGRAGVLLLSAAVFLPMGVWELLRRREGSAAIAAVLLAGLASAPIPATLIGERYMVQREVFVLPFAALIATFGVVRLWRSPRGSVRAATIVLLAAMPVQFAYVYRDYFTHYKLRSAFYYDPAAFGDVADYVLASDASATVPRVYLSGTLDDVSAKWRFYLTKHRREDLLTRTTYFHDEGSAVEAAPPGSLMVLYANPSPDALLRSGQWSLVKTIPDIDHRPASIILRRIKP